jgi:hypothetical protein
MKVVAIKDVEDCFDGSFIKELLLDEETDEHFIQSLGAVGTLSYFPEFARPFFKARISGIAEIKGVQGNRTMRLLLYSEKSMEWLNMFVQDISNQEQEVIGSTSEQTFQWGH